MFRSRAHPCYPEAAQPDGCFPDNPGRPSPFECWLAGPRDQTSPKDRPPPVLVGWLARRRSS